jgi:hypothetical protein
METKKEILEIVRKLVKPNEIKVMDYKSNSIRSVMFEQRNNDVILKELIKKSIVKNDEIKLKLEYFLYTILKEGSTNAKPKKRHSFLKLSKNEQINYLCRCKGLKEIQMLKKELIELNQFEMVNEQTKSFMNDLKKEYLAMLRYTRKFD